MEKSLKKSRPVLDEALDMECASAEECTGLIPSGGRHSEEELREYERLFPGAFYTEE